MKEIPKKDQPDVSGGVISEDYPQQPCFPNPWRDPDSPLVPDFTETQCPSAPTTPTA
jgi:hypothetical protein